MYTCNFKTEFFLIILFICLKILIVLLNNESNVLIRLSVISVLSTKCRINISTTFICLFGKLMNWLCFVCCKLLVSEWCMSHILVSANSSTVLSVETFSIIPLLYLPPTNVSHNYCNNYCWKVWATIYALVLWCGHTMLYSKHTAATACCTATMLYYCCTAISIHSIMHVLLQ